MFERRTLFIVGAGASAEVKFPTGVGLTAEIAGKLRPRVDRSTGIMSFPATDEAVRGALSRLVRRHGFSEQGLIKACDAISRAMAGVISIDNFIDLRAGNVEIATAGKLAIARCILEAERGCNLFVDLKNVYNRLELRTATDTWYQRLSRILADGGSQSDPLENLSFIVFNYDRCIEHYLTEVIHQVFGADYESALAQMRLARIYHPYGKIGDLKGCKGKPEVPFGADPQEQGVDLVGIAEGLRTFTEQMTDHEQLERIREEVASAETIVFLGFGFNKQNMRLLAHGRTGSARHVFCTGYGLSKSDRYSVGMAIQHYVAGHLGPDSIVVEDTTCRGLFDGYSRSLPGSS